VNKIKNKIKNVTVTEGSMKHCSVRVSQTKIPLLFSDIFPKRLGIFLVNFLRNYYTLLSTLDYKFLFSYLQV